MIVRIIEVDTQAVLDNIPASDGIVFYCKENTKAYLDTNNTRTEIHFIISVDALPTTGQIDKVYFLNNTSKMYRYDHEWYEIDSLEDIFDIFVENEESVGCYLQQNGKVITPITSSELVIRPSGEDVECSLLKAETEIKNNLNPYYRYYYPSTDNSTVFIIPLPYERYLADGNTFALFINKVKKELNTDYTINYAAGTITLPTGVPIATLFEFIFYYNTDSMNIKQEVIISVDKVRAYTLSRYTYEVGSDRLSIYINGIKQPKQAYTETSSNSFTLNGDIPKESIIMVEIGKLQNNSNTFFEYFKEDKVVTRTSSTITTVYSTDDYGRTRKIVQDLDSSGRIIRETAFINNAQVAVRNISYNDALGKVTYTHTIV